MIGPEDMVTCLSQTLTPQLLAELTSDILVAKGHTNVKIVDGPGDGCRDLHSIDKNNCKVLSQCKFHQDPLKTVSSKEMGELPMGMIKLNYRKGLFVTNSQVSPQAKREYLDDYSGLELEYLDGREIVATILSNSVLKALWFDGEKISKVSNVLVIPVIARDLMIDKPFPLIESNLLDKTSEIERHLREEFPNIDINVRQDVSSPTQYFAPYKPPRVRTVKEGVIFDIRATEFIISGLLPLDNIDYFLNLLVSGIVNIIEKYHRIRRRAIAIRIGTPSLSPLQGSSVGARLQLTIKPFTMVHIDQQTQEEHEWMKPSEQLSWRFPRTIRASQVNQTRLHNAELDACIDYGLISPPSDQTRHSIIEQREAFAWYWERSLFALIPTHSDENLPKVKLPDSDYAFEWIGAKEFRGWLYGDLSRGIFMSTADDPDSDAHNLLHDSFRKSVEVDEELKELKRIIELIGGEILDPRRARYIVAAILRDPYPSEELVLYGTLELLAEPDDIPSPIDPSSRRLEMTMCWNIGLKANDFINETTLIDLAHDTLARDLVHIQGHVDIDKTTFSGEVYIVLRIEEPIGYDPTCHIDQRITRFVDTVSPVLMRLETVVKESYSKARRATEEYWQSEFAMWF